MNLDLRKNFSFNNIYVVIAIFFSACTYKESSKELDLIGVKVDTLVFSSEKEIIEIGEEGEFLTSSAMSSDASTYFIFNLEKRYLYSLDLKTGNLKSTLKMSSEGPDGIGEWLIDFQKIDDQNFIAQGDNVFYFFNLEGELIDKIRVDHLFYLNPKLAQKFPNTGFLFKNGQLHFSTVKMGTIETQLLSYDPKSDSVLLKEIPSVELVKNSSMITQINSFNFYSSPTFAINNFPGGILVANKGLPNMTAYLINGDMVSTKSNSSKFFEDLDPVEEIFIANNEIEEKEFKKDLEKRMNFLRPVFDEKKQKLYRLGYQLTSDGSSYNNYLFEYDLDLNLTREVLLEGIKIKPKKMFLKDSTFYLTASFEDEPGLLIFENPIQ